MLLTEEEARQAECPFFRFTANEAQVLQNGMHPIVAHRLCAASACKMGWRWATELNTEAEEEFALCRPTGMEAGFSIKGPEPVGYCGFAGKPEV